MCILQRDSSTWSLETTACDLPKTRLGPNPSFQFLSGSIEVGKQTGELTFAVGAYDRSKSLTIDPQLMYSTYLGGSGGAGIGDSGSGIAVDGWFGSDG
jgi:hypothetical protein